MSSTEPPDWVKANQGKAKAAFEQNRAAQDKAPQQAKEQRGSEMVKKQKLSPEHTPRGPMKTAAHAATFRRDLARDNAAANPKLQKALEKNKAAQIRNEKQKQVELNKEKNKDGRDR